MAIAYLHINGTDYELPAHYADPNSNAIDGLRRTFLPDGPRRAGTPQTFRTQVVLHGATTDLLVDIALLTTVAVYTSEPREVPVESASAR
jgi:hypothetical protein